VGSPNVATASIRDNDTTPSNHPPVVVITSPPNGAQFHAPADILIGAVTTDVDGYAPRVEFFANDVLIGEAEIFFIQAPEPGQSISFEFSWSNVVAGSYTLTARSDRYPGRHGHLHAGSHQRWIRSEPTNSILPIVNILAVDAQRFRGPGHVVLQSRRRE
jgi:chitinase